MRDVLRLFRDQRRACGEVCVRTPKENEACGLYCDDSGTPCVDVPICVFDTSCQNGICVKRKVTGTACGGGDPVPCSNVQHCTADPADPTSTGTCQPRTAGGPCHVDNDCPDTEFCLAGTCTVRRALGQSCADADLGCVPWTACDANGVCAVAGRPDFPCAPFGIAWILDLLDRNLNAGRHAVRRERGPGRGLRRGHLRAGDLV